MLSTSLSSGPGLPSCAREQELAWLEGKQGKLKLFRAQTGVNNHSPWGLSFWFFGFFFISVSFAAVQDVPVSQKWLRAQGNEAGTCHESRVPNPCLPGARGGLGAIPAPGKGTLGQGSVLLPRRAGKVQQRGRTSPLNLCKYLKNGDIYRHLFLDVS